VAELHWGVDGRTHRVGANGQTLCRTMIDYSRAPEQRWISGCEVCDVVRTGTPAAGGRSGRGLLLALALVALFSVLLWAALT